MNIRKVRAKLATAVGIIAIFLGAGLYPTMGEPTAAVAANTGPMSLPPVDVVTEWNQQAVALTVPSGQSPIQQARTMAIVHVAVHDAVNGITRAFATYLSPGTAPADASPEAAAIAAAHQALRSLFTRQRRLRRSTLCFWHLSPPMGYRQTIPVSRTADPPPTRCLTRVPTMVPRRLNIRTMLPASGTRAFGKGSIMHRRFCPAGEA